eukprot:CAMPEP_0177660366 /NCGR_PEP_ID=MMETSP0447-20121125/17997_1 /TAXON_ID=0 /ORGANISM="Stygamoeba regulata, Strain BSH-02190019" /LENGTH=79 /DNA_ID=CAMNT_0019165417 /DNA_START=24 /DNA_END=260 /DNA_ORIENTATION=-
MNRKRSGKKRRGNEEEMKRKRRGNEEKAKRKRRNENENQHNKQQMDRAKNKRAIKGEQGEAKKRQAIVRKFFIRDEIRL